MALTSLITQPRLCNGVDSGTRMDQTSARWICHIFLSENAPREILSFTAALLKDGACITRYDNAHGFAHRDALGRKAADTITKQTYSGLTTKEVLHYANQDLTENYAKHYEYYQSH